MLRRCDSTVLSLRNSAAAISRFVLRSVTSSAISSSRFVSALTPVSPAVAGPARLGARARACAARGASRRARAREPQASSSRSASRSCAIAAERSPAAASARPCRLRENAAWSRAPTAARAVGRLRGHARGLQRRRRRRAAPPRACGRRARPAARGPSAAASRSARRAYAPAASRRPSASSTSARLSQSKQRSTGIVHAELVVAELEHRPQLASTSPSSKRQTPSAQPGPPPAVGIVPRDQAPVDAQALLARRDRAVEVARVVARPAELEQRPVELVGLAESRTASTALSHISIASARRPCISNGKFLTSIIGTSSRPSPVARAIAIPRSQCATASS